MNYKVVITCERMPDGEWTYPQIDVLCPGVACEQHERITELYLHTAEQLWRLASRRKTHQRLGQRGWRPPRARGVPEIGPPLSWVQLELCAETPELPGLSGA